MEGIGTEFERGCEVKGEKGEMFLQGKGQGDRFKLS